jgi:hypothetical protein
VPGDAAERAPQAELAAGHRPGGLAFIQEGGQPADHRAVHGGGRGGWVGARRGFGLGQRGGIGGVGAAMAGGGLGQQPGIDAAIRQRRPQQRRRGVGTPAEQRGGGAGGVLEGPVLQPLQRVGRDEAAQRPIGRDVAGRDLDLRGEAGELRHGRPPGGR